MNAIRPSPSNEASALQQLLGASVPQAWWRRPTPWLVLLCLVGAAVVMSIWQERQRAALQTHYVTQPLASGRLVVSVTATGTLQPTNKVDVGSELSGTVARVHVDVNDSVSKGQILVALDTHKLQDQVLRSRAQWQAAQAKVQQAQATFEEAQGHLQRLEQVSQASAGKVPSQAEMATAKASWTKSKAEVVSALAMEQDARAALAVDETNLSKAFIRSPIQGVVLARSVEPGNAVAASLQAVTLLTLAEDLKALKLNVNVDEADVGRVRAGQRATFTVASYPNRTYPAQVRRLAFGSTIKDNVVTYVAELEVSNVDLSLRPGMTATAVITAEEREGVWMVPNAALRFAPDLHPTTEGASGLLSRMVPRMPAQTPRHATVKPGGAQFLWVLKDAEPTPIRVTPGASDGRMTEVQGEGLHAGLNVIVNRAIGSSR